MSTRANQWWESIPFFTSAVVIVCGTIYLICLLFGYDSFYEVCFLPSAVVSQFQGTFMQSDKDDYHDKYVGANACELFICFSCDCTRVMLLHQNGINNCFGNH